MIFKCPNCRCTHEVNTDNMHRVEIAFLEASDTVYCDACCAIASDYFDSAAYQDFEHSENEGAWLV
jgi:hypothetical protein